MGWDWHCYCPWLINSEKGSRTWVRLECVCRGLCFGQLSCKWHALDFVRPSKSCDGIIERTLWCRLWRSCCWWNVIKLLLGCAWVVCPKQWFLNTPLYYEPAFSWRLVLHLAPPIFAVCCSCASFPLALMFWIFPKWQTTFCSCWLYWDNIFFKI